MAKYLPPQGFILDELSGLYSMEKIVHSSAGYPFRLIIKFNPETGEYTQEMEEIRVHGQGPYGPNLPRRWKARKHKRTLIIGAATLILTGCVIGIVFITPVTGGGHRPPGLTSSQSNYSPKDKSQGQGESTTSKEKESSSTVVTSQDTDNSNDMGHIGETAQAGPQWIYDGYQTACTKEISGFVKYVYGTNIKFGYKSQNGIWIFAEYYENEKIVRKELMGTFEVKGDKITCTVDEIQGMNIDVNHIPQIIFEIKETALYCTSGFEEFVREGLYFVPHWQ